MPSKAHIGGAIRTARISVGMSLSDVASIAGVSIATLSRVETDKQSVDVSMLMILSQILHVPASALLGRGGDDRDRDSLARELATLTPADRAEVLATALRQARRGTRSREELRARVDGLLAALDVVREELLQLQRDVSRRC